MKNWKNIQKNIQQRKQQKQEQKNQKTKQKMKQKIKKIYFGKKANVSEADEYVEVTVTYEVIENIGMQEKIDEANIQTEEIQ